MKSVRTLLPVVIALLCGCDDAPPPPQTAPLPTALVKEGQEFLGENAYVHTAALCALGPRSSGSAAYAAQVAYLKELLEEAGWQVVVRDFEPLQGRKMQNVHAVYGAPEEVVRPLLISCHIDTKGQGAEAILGADDGASGAAVMLELARVLAQQPERAARVELVFFDGEESFGKHMTEEDGLYGSRYDVERRGEERLPTHMINLDMVGGAGKVIAVPVMDTSLGMFEHYQRAIAALGFSEERWTLYPGSYLDDHRPFEEAGVETLNLIAHFSGSNWWHTVKDDMSRISPASLSESGRMVLQLVGQLLPAKETEQPR